MAGADRDRGAATTDGTIAVSIALCTYQGERYLPAQLASLLAQSRPPQEIVVFDDASQDGTWELLQAFAGQATERGIVVDLHRNRENVGYVANFEQALRQASGAWVFLCDQDDVWHPDKLARFVAEFRRRPDLRMLHSDATRVDGEGAPLAHRLFEAFEITRDELDRVHHGDAFSVLVRRNIATGATMAVRRDVIERAASAPEGWIHDEWLAMAAATMGRVDCLEEATIDYRQHGANQVGARRRSLADKVTGAGISHADFMARMLKRTQSLESQVAAGRLQLDDRKQRLLSGRLRHARLRADLPAGLAQRAISVFFECLSGRYHRFSNGIRSAAGDLLWTQR